MTATLLLLATCCSALPAGDGDGPEPKAIRRAVEKGLALILKSTAAYPDSRDCFSCHHQAVPVARSKAKSLSVKRSGSPVTGRKGCGKRSMRTSRRTCPASAGSG